MTNAAHAGCPQRVVELPAPPNAGWVLLRGELLRYGGPYSASLQVERGGAIGRLSLPVPSSVKGSVNEVLYLPAGVTRVFFDPGEAPRTELHRLSLLHLHPLRARLLMLKRVLAQLWGLTAAKRRALDLGWLRPVVDLRGAYAAVSRLRAHAPAPAYADWVNAFDTPSPHERVLAARHVRAGNAPQRFVVAICGADAGTRQRTRQALASAQAAAMADGLLEIIELDAESGAAAHLNAALSSPAAGAMQGQCWLLLLRAGCLLAPLALQHLAFEAQAHPQAAVLYGDEDWLDAGGRRHSPCFKPDWSWAHARSAAFVGEAVALRADLLRRSGGVRPDDLVHGPYGAVLRVLDAAQAQGETAHVRHIPTVLLHRAAATPAEAHDAWAMAAVRAHLARRGVAADVTGRGGPDAQGAWRVRYALPAEPPRVTVVVPTRDALALTRRCIESLRTITRYPRYEIVLVDNQSTDPEALAWMREQVAQGTVRLLHYDAPFNYSAINNMAVRQASGELVCLLNNDTEVIEPGWLEEMVTQLLQPGVDVVGAKLLYPNGRVQHAGDLVGVGGVANHAFAWLGRDEPGYCNRAVVAQEYSAVTAACLLTRRQRYLDLGGLDEQHLPVAFNDVDYCLRVREAGGHVVWTPHAVLIHHESVSRGKDETPAQKRRARREARYMRRRWRHVLENDPFYNPNLSHERPDFSLSHAPVVRKPWSP